LIRADISTDASRTLAIQQRSSEVWNLLSAIKAEWTKYGGNRGYKTYYRQANAINGIMSPDYLQKSPSPFDKLRANGL
jgi:hypothetical protein